MTIAELNAPRAGQSGRRLAYAPGRRAWPLVFVAAGLVLFLAYLRQAWTSGVNSDGASNALQAWDMLHGNLMLSGWTVTDISFLTIQLPQLAIAEHFGGLTASVLHVTSALNYTLMLCMVALLARGRATGREGLVRGVVAAGIMLAPPLGAPTTAMLHDPDHVGTQLPLLLIWLILDRARPTWRVPATVVVLLTWAQIADPMATFEGVLPLLLVCALRMYQRRDRPAVAGFSGYARECRLELSLAAGAAVSFAAAVLTLRLIRLAGGFAVLPPDATFQPVRLLYQNAWATGEDLLTVFGADFSGVRFGGAAVSPLLHLAGFGLVCWAVARGVRHCRTGELVVQLLTAVALLLVVAYFLRSERNGGPHEMVGVLVAGSALAGRLLARPLIRGRHLTAVALVLACYAGMLIANAMRPPAVPDANEALATWLGAHGLHYGLAGYWSADIVRFDSRDGVQIAPVYLTGAGRLGGFNRAAKPAWFDPARYDARFLVVPPAGTGCTGGTPAEWLAAARAQFGRPAAGYRVGGFRVLVWRTSLLRSLVLPPPGNPC